MSMPRTDAGPLKKVIISRHELGWKVIRERESNGESGVFETLDACFNYVRCLYENDGQQRQGNLFDEGEQP